MNIRYINLGELSGAEISAEHELTLHTDLETPVITSYCAKKPTLTMTGDYQIDKYIYADKVSENIDIAMIYSQQGQAGSLLLDNNSMLIHLHIKEEYLKGNVKKMLLASIVKVMKKHKIVLSRSLHNDDSNDLVINENVIYKKIGGTWQNSYRKGWLTFGILVCFKPNIEIMKQIYRMDTDKMKSRDVSKIEDVITGIGDLDKNKIVFEISEMIAKRIDFKLIVSEFTLLEKETIKKSIPLLSSKDWIYNAKR